MIFRGVFGFRYNHTAIRAFELGGFDSDGPVHYCVRDIGVALGFGADGGNLTHHIRGKYKHVFSEDRDYLWGEHRAIFMPAGSLIAFLGLVAADEPKRAASIYRFIPKLIEQETA